MIAQRAFYARHLSWLIAGTALTVPGLALAQSADGAETGGHSPPGSTVAFLSRQPGAAVLGISNPPLP